MGKGKRIAVLGSTGSIGIQALEVIAAHPDTFELIGLCAHNNSRLLIEQATLFLPPIVVITNPRLHEEIALALNPLGIEVWSGLFGLETLCKLSEIELILNAIVGYAGLLPTLRTLETGKTLALANKESLVVAGDLVIKTAKKHQAEIIPVDSEHSAIFQCLQGEQPESIEKLILTASGGPFRGKSLDCLQHVTLDQALKHPNWNMGHKITIDSASMMNKGLEVIEAHWLFHIPPEKIEVLIHPQSIVHSLVQFRDGALKAQLGLPDMRHPIAYALSYPIRMASPYEEFRFSNFPVLQFEEPDNKVFRNLRLAYQALAQGGNMPCALNAANEEAVKAFLNRKIRFLQLPDVVEETLSKIPFRHEPSFDDYVSTDQQARKIAGFFISSITS